MKNKEIINNLTWFTKHYLNYVLYYTGDNLFPFGIAKDIKVAIYRCANRDSHEVMLYWVDFYNMKKFGGKKPYYHYSSFYVSWFAMQIPAWREKVREQFKECICEFSLHLEQHFV